MSINRREFVMTGAALAALQGFGVRFALASAASAAPGKQVGCMAWPAATWYRPYVSKMAHEAATTTWLQIDLGRAYPIDSVRLYPAFIPGDEHANDYGFPARFRVEASNDASFSSPRILVDCSGSDFPELWSQITEFAAGGASGRYVRLTATRLRRAQDGVGYRLALGKIDVVSGGKDVAEHCPVTGDTALANPQDLAQITCSPRPMGEGVVTDNPDNVMPAAEWRTVPFQAAVPLSGVRLEDGLFRRAMENNITYLLGSFSFAGYDVT